MILRTITLIAAALLAAGCTIGATDDDLDEARAEGYAEGYADGSTDAVEGVYDPPATLDDPAVFEMAFGVTWDSLTRQEQRDTCRALDQLGEDYAMAEFETGFPYDFDRDQAIGLFREACGR